MQAPSHPSNEEDRLRALRAYDVLDRPADEQLSGIVRVAARLLDVPIALVSLVDHDRQWFAARHGLDAPQTSREVSFCGHVVAGGDALVVEDATQDPRFADNPLVTGEPRVVFYCGVPLETGEGHVLGTVCAIDHRPRAVDAEVVGLLHDLARQVMAHFELRRHHRQLEAARHELELRADLQALAEEAAAIGHWRIDVPTGRLSWSPATFALHRRDPERGPPSVEEAVAYYHPEDRGRVKQAVEEAVRTATSFRLDCRLVRDDGCQRRVVASGQAQRVGDDVGAVYGVFQDITETVELMERMQHAERLASIGTLAAGVAHEINNPLSYVQLNVGVLRDEVGRASEAPEVRELFDDVEDGIRRIRQIVMGLKGFARRRDAPRAPVDLVHVVHAALRLCRHDVGHRARLAVHTTESCFVLADEAELVQVVVNLVMNASEAPGTDRPLEVTVSVQRDGPLGSIDVRDNGGGMDERTRQRSMEPFFTTRGASTGTGLGLYVSREIARSHGGDLVWVSSGATGSCIRLQLPRVESGPHHVAPSGEEAAAADVASVLVIDDQPRVARSIARALKPHRAVVETDPQRALDRLSAAPDRFHLVLCDLMMPGLRGSELYARLPATVQRRTVFLTGGAFTPGAEDFAVSMAERVFAKPPDRDLLRRLAEASLRWGDPLDERAGDPRRVARDAGRGDAGA